MDRHHAEDRTAAHPEEEEEDESCGAKCFIRRIRESRMPTGFKLTSETPKYDGLQEPKMWIEDYLTAVQCQGGTRNTAMQYLQLQLIGSACAWLKSLPSDTIGSWNDLVTTFTRNFQGTYKRPATAEELQTCVQSSRESLRAYIQRWKVMKNMVEEISEENAVDAFTRGLWRRELKEPTRINLALLRAGLVWAAPDTRGLRPTSYLN